MLGDLTALEEALGPASHPIRRAARDPDAIPHPSQLLRNHHRTYSKVQSSAEVAQHMSPLQNRSRSFNAFLDAVLTLTEPI